MHFALLSAAFFAVLSNGEWIDLNSTQTILEFTESGELRFRAAMTELFPDQQSLWQPDNPEMIVPYFEIRTHNGINASLSFESFDATAADSQDQAGRKHMRRFSTTTKVVLDRCLDENAIRKQWLFVLKIDTQGSNETFRAKILLGLGASFFLEFYTNSIFVPNR